MGDKHKNRAQMGAYLDEQDPTLGYDDGGQVGYRSIMFDPRARARAEAMARIEREQEQYRAMRRQGDENAKALAARSGTIGPRTETLREKVGAALAGDSQGPRRGLAEGLVGSSGVGHVGLASLADFLPIDIFGIDEAVRDDDYASAAIGVLPGAAGKGLKGAKAAKAALGSSFMPFAAGGLAKRGAGALGKLIKGDTPAPTILRPDRPIFDYGSLDKVPDVEQRYFDPPPGPARGVPDYVARLGEKGNLDQMDAYVDKGLREGHGGFYNTMQLRDRFIGELGEEEGHRAWARFIDMVGATSPQNKTPYNTRTASYYYMRDRQGNPLRTGEDPPPNPYGHYVQKTHMRGSEDVVDRGGLDPNENPKVARFAENLKGNWSPLTVDIHNLRALGYTDKGGKPLDAPKKEHYGFLEGIQQERALKKGITPAQYQEAAWFGAGDITNLGSPPDPFLKVLEDRLAITAEKDGLSKEDVLRRMIRGEIPLLNQGGYVDHKNAC